MNRPAIILAALVFLLPSMMRAELPEPIKTLKHDDPVDLVAFSPDGKYLAVGNRSTVSLWKLGSDKEPRQLKIPVGRFLSFSFSPDSKFLASTSTDGGVRLWAVATGDEVRTLAKDRMVYVAFSPDGKALTAGSSRSLLMRWNPYTGDELPMAGAMTLRMPSGMRSLAYSPDGRFIVLGGDATRVNFKSSGPGGSVLLDSATGSSVRTFQSRADEVIFAPDSRTVIGWPNEDMIRLWETCTGKERGRIPGKFAAVAVSPDGHLLAAADRSENILRIWDISLLKEIQRLDGHDSDITSLAFSLDGKTLASGGGDFVTLLWDMTEISKKRTTEPISLTETDLKNRWTFLGADDAERAYQVIVSLSRSPREAVPFLQEQLQRSSNDPKRLARLIAELDSNDYDTRETATNELARLGNEVEPALKQALERNPPLEVVRRIESLLEKMEKGALSAEQVRQVRVIEALERMRTADAHALLEKLASQTPATVMSSEARESLRKLRNK